MAWNVMKHWLFLFGEFSYLLLLRSVRICFIVSILAFFIFGIKKWLFSREPLEKLLNPIVRWYLWSILWISLFFGRSKLFSLSWEPWRLAVQYLQILEHNSFIRVCYFSIVFLLFFLHYQKTRNVKRYIRALPQYTDSEGIWAMAQEKLGHCFLIPPIRVVVARQELSPFSFGLLHPVIVLPVDYQTKYQKEELAYVFYHEANHIRHFDLWLLKGLTLVKAIWWFAPWISFLIKQMKRDMEAACDYRTLALPGTSFYDYGMTILKSAPKEKQASVEVGLAIAGKDDTLQKRILEITRFRPFCKSTLWIIRTVFFCVIFCCIFFVKVYSLPSYQWGDTIQLLKVQKEPVMLLTEEEVRSVITIDQEQCILIQGDKLYQLLQEKKIPDPNITLFRIFLEKESEQIYLGQSQTILVNTLQGKEIITIPLCESFLDQIEAVIWKYI